MLLECGKGSQLHVAATHNSDTEEILPYRNHGSWELVVGQSWPRELVARPARPFSQRVGSVSKEPEVSLVDH